MKSTDEVYGSLAYDGAPLLRVPLCVSRAFLVSSTRQASGRTDGQARRIMWPITTATQPTERAAIFSNNSAGSKQVYNGVVGYRK